MYAGEPIAMIIAVVASKPSMSRNSVFSNPLTENHFQFFPPSVVLPTAPLLPLTHTTSSLTTLNPRKEDLAPEVRTSSVGISFFWAKQKISEQEKRREV